MAQPRRDSIAVSSLETNSPGFDAEKAKNVYIAWRMVRLTRAAGLDFEERVHDFERALEEFLR